MVRLFCLFFLLLAVASACNLGGLDVSMVPTFTGNISYYGDPQTQFIWTINLCAPVQPVAPYQPCGHAYVTKNEATPPFACNMSYMESVSASWSPKQLQATVTFAQAADSEVTFTLQLSCGNKLELYPLAPVLQIGNGTTLQMASSAICYEKPRPGACTTGCVIGIAAGCTLVFCVAVATTVIFFQQRRQAKAFRERYQLSVNDALLDRPAVSSSAPRAPRE